ncbi:MAG: type II toxin-antitoxin system RelE/ParE family toxin [Alphaproteobacteria bacterium]|nr:type II toxin-antitoxin system RelE/ParE family toxin [Alphaproteobacteria bacterium]
MLEVVKTETFDRWLLGLRDLKARGIILARIDRVAQGLTGNVKAVGEGLSELKIDVGPGYRVYFKLSGQIMMAVLCGGDKSTQSADIAKARAILHELGL